MDVRKLNPYVLPSGDVRRVYETKLNRGNTPPVLIRKPDTPFFDPFNHSFANSNAVKDNLAGPSFPGGWTALHAAAQAKEAGPHEERRKVEGDLEEMRFLLQGLGHHVPPPLSQPHAASPKIDVNAATSSSRLTPLHVAVKAGHTDATVLLLHSRANPFLVDMLGRTPLHHASEQGYDGCVKALLAEEEGGRKGRVWVRVDGGEVDGGRMKPNMTLLICIAHVLRGEKLQSREHPLHARGSQILWELEASLDGCWEEGELVVEVSSKNAQGVKYPPSRWSTPLRELAREQEIRAVLRRKEGGEGAEEGTVVSSMLLRAKFDSIVDLQDQEGNSALMLAAANGRNEIVRLLLSLNADPNRKDVFQMSAAARAALAGHDDVCKMIEAAGGEW